MMRIRWIKDEEGRLTSVWTPVAQGNADIPAGLVPAVRLIQPDARIKLPENSCLRKAA
ncbi:MAG: hypothetical protein P4L70_01590 [Parasulfuritortus sp.]|nr:hypothetical protein [Parasulfuritortus sp.]